MKGKRVNSETNIIDLIHPMESDLGKLKKAISNNKQNGREKRRPFRSFREFEFCDMWKDRKNMKGLSGTEWLTKIRKEQWR